jgi:TFIIF-interacting CTD phosphatase-like protein
MKERPFLEPFFRFIFDNFDSVSIWTNAQLEWFQKANHEILQKYIPKNKKFTLVLVNSNSIPKIKNLNKIFNQYPLIFNSSNTFILDDTPFTYQNNTANAIPIQSYSHFNHNDQELLRIMCLLNKHLFQKL